MVSVGPVAGQVGGSGGTRQWTCKQVDQSLSLSGAARHVERSRQTGSGRNTCESVTPSFPVSIALAYRKSRNRINGSGTPDAATSRCCAVCARCNLYSPKMRKTVAEVVRRLCSRRPKYRVRVVSCAAAQVSDPFAWVPTQSSTTRDPSSVVQCRLSKDDTCVYTIAASNGTASPSPPGRTGSSSAAPPAPCTCISPAGARPAPS